MSAQDRLGQLTDAGVSIWLDDISRDRLTTGNLAGLVKNSHVKGVTSNPTIFAHAMDHGNAYDAQLTDLGLREVGVDEALREMTTHDIRWACDVLRPVYDASDGIDGKVSIEVDPRDAGDTRKTVAEARALWWLVDRPNLYVKIPATLEGLPAITACLAEGICINVTLIFSLERYEQVMDAFMAGLEAASDADVARLTSVASFFVSRVDTEVDKRLDAIGAPEAKALRGKAAVANARLAYELFEKHHSTPRWRALAARGARVQRPLWASTSTKDPSYKDTLYVDDLVAPNTVNTMPEATLHATADHGTIVPNAIAGTYDESRAVISQLEGLGISYDDVVDVLEREGVAKFADSWAGVREVIGKQLESSK
ncbi:MAG TPA: transaldolase [Streptosporangiaceae bacterium]|nr:transaldolase [Streptosporangiaceae bacterium]